MTFNIGSVILMAIVSMFAKIFASFLTQQYVRTRSRNGFHNMADLRTWQSTLTQSVHKKKNTYPTSPHADAIFHSHKFLPFRYSTRIIQTVDLRRSNDATIFSTIKIQYFTSSCLTCIVHNSSCAIHHFFHHIWSLFWGFLGIISNDIKYKALYEYSGKQPLDFIDASFCLGCANYALCIHPCEIISSATDDAILTSSLMFMGFVASHNT